MPTTVSAREAAAEVPLCPPCVKHEGLCASHAPSVLPQMKHPSWHRDAHSFHHQDDQAPAPVVDAETRRANRAAARRRHRAEQRKRERLNRSVKGEFTRVRKSRAA